MHGAMPCYKIETKKDDVIKTHSSKSLVRDISDVIEALGQKKGCSYFFIFFCARKTGSQVMFEKGATRRGSKCRYDLRTQPCQLTARTLDFLEAVENTES